MEVIEFRIRKEFKDYLKLRGWNLKKFCKVVGYLQPQVSAILNRKIEPSYHFVKVVCAKCRLDIGDVIENYEPKEKSNVVNK